jgi:hypothetical protein
MFYARRVHNAALSATRRSDGFGMRRLIYSQSRDREACFQLSAPVARVNKQLLGLFLSPRSSIYLPRRARGRIACSVNCDVASDVSDVCLALFDLIRSDVAMAATSQLNSNIYGCWFIVLGFDVRFHQSTGVVLIRASIVMCMSLLRTI